MERLDGERIAVMSYAFFDLVQLETVMIEVTGASTKAET